MENRLLNKVQNLKKLLASLNANFMELELTAIKENKMYSRLSKNCLESSTNVVTEIEQEIQGGS